MEAKVWEIEASGESVRPAEAGELKDNAFYRFDAEALLAVSRAIEDVALHEAHGCLLTTLQASRDREAERDRLQPLAAVLDDVRLFVRDRALRSSGHLHFADIRRTALECFWTVLFQGRRCQALLICRQSNASAVFAERQFCGFYSFAPQLIARFRQDIEQALRGRAARLQEFDRQEAFDRAAKRVKHEFAHERDLVDGAVRKLLGRGEPDRFQQFTGDLEKSLHRLRQLKDRLPVLLGAAAGNGHQHD